MLYYGFHRNQVGSEYTSSVRVISHRRSKVLKSIRICVALLAVLGASVFMGSQAKADTAVINDFHFSGHTTQGNQYSQVLKDNLLYDYQGSWTGTTNYLAAICSWIKLPSGPGGEIFSTTHSASPASNAGTTTCIHNGGVRYSLIVRVGPAGQSNPTADEWKFTHD
jgi:hypothetical protein